MTNNDITKAYMGVSEVDKIYLGDALIYPTTPPVPPEPVYSAMPLTFEIISGGTITWARPGGNSNDARTIDYKKNEGSWISITSNIGSSAPSISVVAGDIVQFRGSNGTYYFPPTSNRFQTTCSFKIYGNILSMIYSDNFINETDLPSGSTAAYMSNFRQLFYENTGLTEAGNLIMPQNVKNSCYRQMFYGCTNMVTPPTLPALTLEPYCYYEMFMGCSNLNYIKCMATDISATQSTESWLNRVSAIGTFVKHPNMNNWTTGASGIPTDWTVQDAS